MGGALKRSAARRLVELWARGKSFWRKLPAEFGGHPVCVSPDARLRHFLPGSRGFDRELLSAARALVDAQTVTWDVGANVGVFAVAAASRARRGRVLAVEPDPWLVGLLVRTIDHRKNRDLAVNVLAAALGHECGLASLVIAERGRASNHLASVRGREMADGTRQTQLVPMLTLDAIAEEEGFPHLVKIDCEGAELPIVTGGQHVFEEGRPAALIEVGHDSSPKVVNWLRERDYTIFDGPDRQPWRPDVRETRNLLAVPTEHV